MTNTNAVPARAASAWRPRAWKLSRTAEALLADAVVEAAAAVPVLEVLEVVEAAETVVRTVVRVVELLDVDEPVVEGTEDEDTTELDPEDPETVVVPELLPETLLAPTSAPVPHGIASPSG